MSRKRLWEIGGTVALLLALGVLAAGFFYQWERQRRLDEELVWLLSPVMAPEQGDCDRCLSLIRQGASVRLRGELTGWTVLHLAIHRDHRVLFQEVLARGADVNAATTDGLTPLMVAASDGRHEMTRFLLEQGADVTRKDTSGRTALTHAVTGQRPAIVRLLQEHGAKQ
jgi:uncharacterized protein